MGKYNINYKLLTKEQLAHIDEIKREFDEILECIEEQKNEYLEMCEQHAKSIEIICNSEISDYIRSLQKESE